MKLITKNSQIVSGMCVNLINKNSPDDRKDNVIVDRSFDDDYVRIECVAVRIPEDPKSKYCWELVSYPPRRPVTWEWVKENIDHVPGLVFYNGDDKHEIENVSKVDIIDSDGGCWEYGERNLYIDAPHPEVPDVPAPWELKPEKKLTKEYIAGKTVELKTLEEMSAVKGVTLQGNEVVFSNGVRFNIKMEEEAKLTNRICRVLDDGTGDIKSNWTIIPEMVKRIIDEPAEEKKSLWWSQTPGEITRLGLRWESESDILKDAPKGLKYQPVTRPVHEGPTDDWRSI